MHLISGGAGFIAVNLARRLRALGHLVLLLDDLSRGRQENLSTFTGDNGIRFIEVDVADDVALRNMVLSAADGEAISDVWHLAANSDIQAGTNDLRVDLHRTFLTTSALLVLMREIGASALHFASSSAVYGDLGDVELDEESGPLHPISFYGAMKLASEAQIRAAVEAFLSKANIFRFPNVVGVPATHGVILDFIAKLRADPARLDVLGDGKQRKPYLHVHELVDAMLFIANNAAERFNVLNIGPEDDGVRVSRIAELVCAAVSPGAAIHYGSEPRGWIGDVPRFRYSVRRLAELGWRPTLTSEDAVRRAIDEVVTQEIRR